MKTIIVATDFSAAANNALGYAANLASAVDADLVLFNAYHMSTHAINGMVGPEVLDRLVRNNEKQLQDLSDETAQKYNISVSWVSKTDDTIEGLNHYVKDHHPGLVVIGMESNVFSYELLGNTTTAAIKHLKTPILVVPRMATFSGIEKILYAYEPSYLDQHNQLDLMKEIARKFRAQLEVFHVDTHPKKDHPENEENLIHAANTILKDIPHTYSTVSNETIAEGIAQEVDHYNADLLVMVPHKTGFLASLFKGSNTRRVSLKTKVPLLVIPNGE